MTLDNILEEIRKANTIAILTHESPDGDAVGTSLALYLALKEYGKNPDVIIPQYSRTYAFLPGSENIKKEGIEESYDLAISVDCADIKMLNGFAKYFENAKVSISIDHHSTNKMFGDYNYIDPVAPACAQVLIVILDFLKINITKEIGTCILTGLITDTGGFKYSSVTPETFEFVAWLLNKGVKVSEVYKKVLQTKTKANFELTKLTTNRMEFLEDGKITFTYITKEDEQKVNAEPGDHEGLVEIGRDVAGVEVSIFLREIEGGFKVSLRSNEYVNVSDVCLMFGGGGHLRAAGCSIMLPLEEAKQKAINQVKMYLK